MKTIRKGLLSSLLIASLAAVGSADAAIVKLTTIDSVVVVGSQAVLDLRIEYEAGEPTSLFSFGARLDVTGPGSVVVQSIDAVPELDFFGSAGAGAFEDASLSVLGIKGTVQVSPPAAAYAGALLAQYLFEFPEEGEYTFTPRVFNTLGPTEEIFVAGDGTVLDAQLVFEPVTVTVVPEPSPIVLGLVAWALFYLRSRQRKST